MSVDGAGNISLVCQRNMPQEAIKKDACEPQILFILHNKPKLRTAHLATNSYEVTLVVQLATEDQREELSSEIDLVEEAVEAPSSLQSPEEALSVKSKCSSWLSG